MENKAAARPCHLSPLPHLRTKVKVATATATFSTDMIFSKVVVTRIHIWIVSFQQPGNFVEMFQFVESSWRSSDS